MKLRDAIINNLKESSGNFKLKFKDYENHPVLLDII